jgi:hypothetical protein
MCVLRARTTYLLLEDTITGQSGARWTPPPHTHPHTPTYTNHFFTKAYDIAIVYLTHDLHIHVVFHLAVTIAVTIAVTMVGATTSR